MSIAWPMDRPAHLYDPAPLVAALAVRQTLRRAIERAGRAELAAELQVKWPNDLLLGGRKVAGVLCERTLAARVGEEASRRPAAAPTCLIIGVGVNVDFDLSHLPEDALRFPATTLREALGAPGAPVGVEEIIDVFSRRMLAFPTARLTVGQAPSRPWADHFGADAVNCNPAGKPHNHRSTIPTTEDRTP